MLELEDSLGSEAEAETMIETLGKRLMEQGRAEGRQEGRQEGAVQEARRALIDVLEARFGKKAVEPKAYYVEELTSVTALNRLIRKAVKADTIDDLGLGK